MGELSDLGAGLLCFGSIVSLVVSGTLIWMFVRGVVALERVADSLEDRRE